MPEKERITVEKEANKIVRSKFCPRPEYYQVPKWIKQGKARKAYYLERLQWEIDIRNAAKALLDTVSYYISNKISDQKYDTVLIHDLLNEESFMKNMDDFFAAIDDSHGAKVAYKIFKNTNQLIRDVIVNSVLLKIEKQFL